MKLIEYIEAHTWAANTLESLLLVVLLFALQRGLVRLVTRKDWLTPEQKQLWKVRLRNSCLVLLGMGLLLIWATELKTLAFSLVAFAVAFVVSVKELITCLTGTLLNTTSGSFTVGDRIIIGDMRGDVVDQSLVSTTLLEVGPGKEMHQQTGRSITLPNSILLTSPVINEGFQQDFVLHALTVPVKFCDDWERAGEVLRGIADEVCRPYLKEARRHFQQLATERSLVATTVEPRISIVMPDPERINLILRIPAPFRSKGRIEQEIVQRFIKELRILRANSAATDEPQYPVDIQSND